MKKIMAISFIMCLIILGVLWYIILPVISINFIHLSMIAMAITTALFVGSFAFIKEGEKFGKLQKSTLMLLSVTVIYFLVSLIGSASFIHWENKQTQLDLNEITEFDTSVPNVDMANLIILDENDARRTSEKLLTEKNPSLGSQFQIGRGTLSVVKDKPFWVFPLEHRGFFKWLRNSGEIPGYILVSATDFNTSKFVDYTYAISPTGFMSDDLKRSIYMKYPNVGQTDFSFEIDDDEKGYWVVTAYTHDNWLSTTKVIGTIIVDPVDKSMDFYEVGEQPDWVDRVFPVNVFLSQIDWYGKFINGWWNPSDEGKLTDTEGMGYVFKEGTLYFYTGLTSVGKDSATTGFVIYNPKTGTAEYNRISGSIETKAIGLMEELVQNAGYTATFPYLININGEATYFSTLKGNSGNVVGYAFASVQNYKAVAWAKTLREAQTEYNRVLIREGGNNALTAQTSDLTKMEGPISRIGALTDGYYVIKILGVETLYVINSEQFPIVSLSEVGDNVIISYLTDLGAEKIDAIEFVNNSIR